MAHSKNTEKMIVNNKEIMLDDALWVLQCIMDDLPTNRDWLDPNIEAFAQLTLTRAKSFYGLPKKLHTLNVDGEVNQAPNTEVISKCKAKADNNGVCQHWEDRRCRWPRCEQ